LETLILLGWSCDATSKGEGAVKKGRGYPDLRPRVNQKATKKNRKKENQGTFKGKRNDNLVSDTSPDATRWVQPP